MLVCESDYAVGSASKCDRLFQSAFTGSVEGCVDSVGDLSHVGEQVTAVENWGSPERAGEGLVPRAYSSDDFYSFPNRQLRRDSPDRSTRPYNKEGFDTNALDVP